jgi:hypothetical protein
LHSVLAETSGKNQLQDQQQPWLAAEQGRFLALCGFGNLPGDITFLDKKADGKCKVISQVRCSTLIAEPGLFDSISWEAIWKEVPGLLWQAFFHVVQYGCSTSPSHYWQLLQYCQTYK